MHNHGTCDIIGCQFEENPLHTLCCWLLYLHLCARSLISGIAASMPILWQNEIGWNDLWSHQTKLPMCRRTLEHLKMAYMWSDAVWFFVFCSISGVISACCTHFMVLICLVAVLQPHCSHQNPSECFIPVLIFRLCSQFFRFCKPALCLRQSLCFATFKSTTIHVRVPQWMHTEERRYYSSITVTQSAIFTISLSHTFSVIFPRSQKSVFFHLELQTKRLTYPLTPSPFGDTRHAIAYIYFSICAVMLMLISKVLSNIYIYIK